MIIVVAGGEPGVQGDGSPIGEVEAIQQALAVVDQRLAVPGPVGRLERLGRAVHDRALPRRDVEDLQIAPDVVPVGHEPVPRGGRDAHVAERGSFDHRVVMRADEQPDVDRVAERQVPHSYRRQAVPEAAHGECVPVPRPLELNDVARHGRPDLLGGAPARAAVLQRDKAVPVDRGRHVGRTGREVGSDRPPELAMRLHARPVELRPREQEEIPLDAPPHEVKVVAVEPHVRARARDGVPLPHGVIRDRAPLGHLPDVGLTVEETQRCLLRRRPSSGNGEGQNNRRQSQPTGCAHVPERLPPFAAMRHRQAPRYNPKRSGRGVATASSTTTRTFRAAVGSNRSTFR